MNPSVPRFLPLLITLFSSLAIAAGENPQLQPHAAKYAQDRQALEETRTRQAETLRTRYTTALAAARVEALKANRGGAVAAIDAEMTDARSDVHSPAAPPDLPRALAGARREFLTGFETLEKTAGARMKELNARYLQTLDVLGRSAESQKNVELATAVAEEKTRLLAAQATPAVPALRKNAILNGEFETADEAGLPTGWKPKGADHQGDNVPWANDALIIQEGSEKFLRFRRTAPVSLANLTPGTVVMVPERAKAAIISVRMRVAGLLPGNSYHQYPGVALKAFDATGSSPGPTWVVAKEDTRWRTFTGRLSLQPGAKTIEVTVGPWAAAGICDFDDVTVKFE